MDKDRNSAFGLDEWLVEPTFNRLTRGDVNHRVEPKVMNVLVELAARSGQVVSKNEIIHAVWPDTFVGEDALTRCISVLRHLLSDDPRTPRFIQTVSKTGYCLMVHPSRLTEPRSDVSHPDLDAPTLEARIPDSPIQDPAQVAAHHLAAKPAKRPGLTDRIRVAIGALALSSALLLTIWIFPVLRSNSVPPSFQTFQLTTSAGEQSWPVLSPDGKRLAFVWAKGDGSRQHIYIKQMGSESLVRLTNMPDDEYSPAWSPDGTQIAFLSSSQEGLGLYIVSLSSSAPVRKVYIPGVTTRWEQGALSWSPDGKHFALVDHLGGQANSAIYLIDLATLRARALTAPPSGWEGDLCPIFSRDGEKIAFLRGTESWVMDLYWISTNGGEAHQITHDGKAINGIAWSSDDRSIVFSSSRAGQYALWSVSLPGGVPRRLPVGTEFATQPAISHNGNSLVFVEGSALFSILRVSTPNTASHESGELAVLSSTALDSAPALSPDGTQFAFQSQRSGSQQIWISSTDGQTLRQLTPLDANLSISGSPAWSPDGSQVLFDSRINGHAHVFAIGAGGGTARQISFGDVNDIIPRWSVDGRTIYFRSNRGGRWQLWKVSAKGGAPQPVTSEDGIAGQESPDGKWLYFARGAESGIWRMPASGGAAVQVLHQPEEGFWAYWEVTRNGIYFLDQSQPTPKISIYDPTSEKISFFTKLDRQPPLYFGMSVFKDGKSVLISDRHDAGSHITMTQGKF